MIRWIRAHPDLVAILLVALVALTVRSAFAFRVPAFVTKDSIEYVEPALALVDGEPFALAQRRTPVYPIVMAGSVAIFGRDLLAITFAQHLLGIGTADLHLRHRAPRVRSGGRAAGGPRRRALQPAPDLRALPDHRVGLHLLPDPLDAAAGRRPRRPSAGRTSPPAASPSALAALTRPVGQAVLVALPLAAILVFRRWRPSLTACALAGGCFALLVVPWAIRNQVVYGTAGAASTGRFLISRSVKHERNFVFYEEAVGAYPGEDPQRTRARKIAQEVTDKRPEPGQIFQRIRDNLNLTEAQTDAMLQGHRPRSDHARPDALGHRHGRDVLRAAEGRPEGRGGPLAPGGPRAASGGEPVGPLQLPAGGAAAGPRQRGRRRRSAGTIFRPSRVAWWIVGLGLVGALLALVVPAYRVGILPFLVAFVLIAVSAMLVGDVPRYRYPVDPLMYVMAAGGLVGLVGLAARPVRAARAVAVSPHPRPLVPEARAETDCPRPSRGEGRPVRRLRDPAPGSLPGEPRTARRPFRSRAPCSTRPSTRSSV